MGNKIDDGDELAEDDIRRLLHFIRKWSGGDTLWERLCSRLQESFSALVILPALIKVFETHKALTDNLRSLSQIRKIASKEQVENERQSIEKVRIKLHNGVGDEHMKLRNLLTQFADDIKSGDLSDQKKEYLRTKWHRWITIFNSIGFEGLLDSINIVTSDLIMSLIAPVRDALKKNRSAYDLEVDLQKVLEPLRANKLSRAYDAFSRKMPLLSRTEGRFILRIREDDPQGLQDLKNLEGDALRLYQNMRECLAARGTYLLQTQTASIHGALSNLLDRQTDAITGFAKSCLLDLPDLRLEEAINSLMQAQTSTDQIKLPNEFFKLPTAVNTKTFAKTEVVGQCPVKEIYETGTCFHDTETRTVIKDSYGSVSYRDLALSDEDGMARDWSSGIKIGEASLWETLRDWMVDSLEESSIAFTSAIDSVLHLAENALKEQERLVDNEYEATQKLWKCIDEKIEQIEHVKIAHQCSVTGTTRSIQ
jgi:hypothetical protein